MDTATNVPIDGFSITDKLILMERLWADLSQRPADTPTPDWHGDILAERIAALKDGRTAFVEWSVAKQRLRDRLK